MTEHAAPKATGSAPAADLAGQVADVVRAEFDQVVPHLVAALKRDRAFDALAERLQTAERRLDARRERPTMTSLLALLHRLRHLDIDPEIFGSIDAEIVEILRQAGYREFGEVGEPFDPGRHEALEGRTIGGGGVVRQVFASGLASFDEVVVRAKVHVEPEPASARPVGYPSEHEPLTPVSEA